MSTPQRADAVRNRDKLLAAALEAFTREGLDASLDAIAKSAGVGNATLYRHFPTREALIVATYENEVERLADLAEQMLQTAAPEEALLGWMSAYVDYVATKRGMAEVLRHVANSDEDFYLPTRQRTLSALRLLLEAGAHEGSIRDDVEPTDIYRAMTAVCLAAPDTEWQAQSKRLLELIVNGLRYEAETPTAGLPHG